MRWTERLEVVGLEPLGLAHCLSRRTVYSHVARLEAAGLVERIYDRNGTLVAITRAGRVTVRPEHPDPRAATQSLAGGALALHARATAWVAARATLRDLRWVSDREMRSLPVWQVPVIWRRSGRHRPDLGVTANGGRVAVEVELTAKAHRGCTRSWPATAKRSRPAASPECSTWLSNRSSALPSSARRARSVSIGVVCGSSTWPRCSRTPGISPPPTSR